MAFLLWTPQVGVPLMMGCFIIFAFGALRMGFEASSGSTALALAMGLVIALLGGVDCDGEPGQRIVSGLWFAVVLRARLSRPARRPPARQFNEQRAGSRRSGRSRGSSPVATT
jgi:hypothetical protein